MFDTILRGLALAAAAALCTPALAQHKAHQHGLARLDIAVESGRISIVLDTPLENLVGFERAPHTDAERRRVDAALERLRAAAAIFRIDGAAGCVPAEVELISPVLGLGGSAPADEKSGHADLEGRFDFACTQGARAGFVEVGLFEAFSGLRRLEVQIATPRGQMKATLRRPASRVALVR